MPRGTGNLLRFKTASQLINELISDGACFISSLSRFSRESNRRINNVDLVLTLKRGQIEVETQDLVPELGGAVLLKEGLISNLNGDIGVS